MYQIVKLFQIAIIVITIIDLSGLIPSIEMAFAKWLKVSKVRIPKPFSCSYCMTFWIGLGWLIYSSLLTISNLMLLLLICQMTRPLGLTLNAIFESMLIIPRGIETLIDKIMK